MINRERGHTMFKRIMRGMKGFTLIELLAVMAIVAGYWRGSSPWR